MNNKHVGLALNRVNNEVARLLNRPLLSVNGIQRSGTNYLSACLRQLKITPVNYHRVDEGEFMHKHQRWNAQSFRKIPALAQMFPICDCDNVSSLNQLCGYPAKTRHIVIRKDLESSLVSISNFSLRSGWYADVDTVLANLGILAADYSEYYAFWSDLAKRDPESVMLVDYEELIDNFSILPATLLRLGINVQLDEGGKFGAFKELNMSPSDRPQPISRSMVLEALA